MAAPTRTPRSSWIAEGLRALAAGGSDAVRIEPLAKALGVTRGGFYWHFDDRRALLEEILDSWERASVDEVIERIENEGGDARAKLRRLSGLAASSNEPLRIDLAVRDWARREQTIAERLRRVDNRRMDYMRSLFGAFCWDEDEVEARCMVFYSLWIGNHFIAADHGTRGRADVVKVVLRWARGLDTCRSQLLVPKLARTVYGLIKNGTDYRPSSKRRFRVDEPSLACSRWGVC